MLIDKYSSPGKSTVACEDCGETREVTRTGYVVKNTEHPCRVCSNKRNGIAKRGKYVSWSKQNAGTYSIKEPGTTKYINSSGYVEVWCGKLEGSRGRKDGYRLEHHLVVEDEIGRPLEPGEVIHHIDGTKQNNDSDNLLLCESQLQHRAIHAQLEEIAFRLVREGYIKFDPSGKFYYLEKDLND